MTKSSPPEAFPERLKKARELRELNQADLAERTGLQPSAVSHFETGTRRPSFDNLRRLADALQVSTDYLLGRTESMTADTGTDVLFRKIDSLSAQDREFIDTVAEQLAAKKRKGKGGGKGT